jgi:hypothetical protein
MDNEAPELAEKQSAKINKHGGKRVNSGGRRSGAGRKKGSPNKLTADVKAAITEAFEEVGGTDYLKTVASDGSAHILYAARQDPADASCRGRRGRARPH